MGRARHDEVKETAEKPNKLAEMVFYEGKGVSTRVLRNNELKIIRKGEEQ